MKIAMLFDMPRRAGSDHKALLLEILSKIVARLRGVDTLESLAARPPQDMNREVDVLVTLSSDLQEDEWTDDEIDELLDEMDRQG